jgi:ribosomal protein S18 acetylase RimI-like enzyme
VPRSWATIGPVHLTPPTPDDLPFLRAMLVEAAFPPGAGRPADPLADDHVARYLDGWGAPGDLGLVARETTGPLVGAAWTRLLPADRPGYGYTDAATPELTVAVAEAARGRGIGRALVAGALDHAAAHGHERVGLSVTGSNVVATGLYRSLGFAPVGVVDGSTTMVAPTAPAGPGPGATPTARPATDADGPAVARLRRIMFGALGVAADADWVAPLLALWPAERGAGRWVGALALGPDGRPVAAALAVLYPSPPGPGRPQGRVAHVGSVATEPAWRRRGAARTAVTALVAHLDEIGVESSTLSASPAGAGLYRPLGFHPGDNVAMRRPHP